MTQDEWNANPMLALELRADLAKPHWQAALDILIRRSPAKANRNITAVALAAQGLPLAGQIVGYEQALGYLNELAYPEEHKRSKLTETYGITDPKKATD